MAKAIGSKGSAKKSFFKNMSLHQKILSGVIVVLVAVSGYVGYSYYQDMSADAASLSGCPTLRQGSRGSCVKALQETLNGTRCHATLTADGIFGAKTRDVVVQYQRANRLTADGIVGAQTRAKLASASRCGSGTAVQKGYTTVISTPDMSVGLCATGAKGESRAQVRFTKDIKIGGTQAVAELRYSTLSSLSGNSSRDFPNAGWKRDAKSGYIFNNFRLASGSSSVAVQVSVRHPQYWSGFNMDLGYRKTAVKSLSSLKACP